MVLELGGNFKETLRQLGGLDDIFNVMVNCHSELEVRPYLCVCMFSNSLYKTIKLALFVILFCYGKGWLTFEPCTIHAPVYLKLQSERILFGATWKTCCKTKLCCNNCFDWKVLDFKCTLTVITGTIWTLEKWWSNTLERSRVRSNLSTFVGKASLGLSLP